MDLVQRLPKAAVQNCARVAGNDESIEEDDEVRKQSCTFQEKINY